MALPKCQAFDAFALHECKYPKLVLAMQIIRGDTTVKEWGAWEFPPHLLIAGFPIPPLCLAAYVGNVGLVKHMESAYRQWCDKVEKEEIKSRSKWYEYDVAWWNSEKRILARKRMFPQKSLLAVACGERGQTPLHYAIQGWDREEYTCTDTLCEMISFVALSDPSLLNVLDYRTRLTPLDWVIKSERQTKDKERIKSVMIKLGAKNTN